MTRAGQVTQNLHALKALEAGAGREGNPALDDWSARDGQ